MDAFYGQVVGLFHLLGQVLLLPISGKYRTYLDTFTTFGAHQNCVNNAILVTISSLVAGASQYSALIPIWYPNGPFLGALPPS